MKHLIIDRKRCTIKKTYRRKAAKTRKFATPKSACAKKFNNFPRRKKQTATASSVVSPKNSNKFYIKNNSFTGFFLEEDDLRSQKTVPDSEDKNIFGSLQPTECDSSSEQLPSTKPDDDANLTYQVF